MKWDIQMCHLESRIGLLEEGVDVIGIGGLGQVVAGRKDVTHAGENHNGYALIVVDLGQHTGHLLVGDPVDAVLLLRIVELGHEQLALLLHKQFLVSLVGHLADSAVRGMSDKVQSVDHFTVIAGSYCCLIHPISGHQGCSQAIQLISDSW